MKSYSWGIRFADIQGTCLPPDVGECAYEHREHALIYVRQGEMDVTADSRTTHFCAGECAFVRRDYKVTILKRCIDDAPFLSTTLVFKHDFLVEELRRMDTSSIPKNIKRPDYGILKIPVRPDIKSLFDSIMPFLESKTEPSEQWIHSKMSEGLRAVLATDSSFYASLFDFANPWKIDILDFMNRHYRSNMSLAEMAQFTGRSLAQFKRDFAKVSDLTPQKWVYRKRLEVARDMLSQGDGRVRDGRVCDGLARDVRVRDVKVRDVMEAVGFTNLSHFSRIYKEAFGVSPSQE